MSRTIYSIIFLFMLLAAGYLYFLAPESTSAFGAAGTDYELIYGNNQEDWSWDWGLLDGLGSLLDLSVGSVFYAITWLVYQIVAFLFRVSIYMMERAIDFSVLNFGQVAEKIEMIEIGWTVIRDIANIAFIFILLYIAVMIILRLSGTSTYKLLSNVVVIALLVNFSLFAAQSVIDISNVIGGVFWESTANTSVEIDTSTGAESQVVTGPTAAILQGLKLESIFDEVEENPDFGQADAAMIYFFATIFMAVTTFVFGALAFLFTIRVVMLIIYMMASPLGFIGLALPNMGGMAKKWWNGLLKHSFWAPITLFMIWLVSQITAPGEDGTSPLLATTEAGEGSLAGAILGAGSGGGGVDHLATIFNFVLLISFTALILVLPSKVGATGAATAVSWGRYAAHSTRRGVQGAAGRTTIGRAARGAGRLYDRAEAGVQSTKTGRYLSTGANILTLGGAGALNRGARGTLKKGEEAKFGSKASLADTDKAKRTRKQKLKTQSETAKKRGDLNNAMEAVARRTPGAADDLRTAFKKANPELLEEMGVSKLTKNAEYLNSKNLEALDKIAEKEGGKYSKEDVKKIKDEYNKTFISGSAADIGTRMDEMTADDIAKIPTSAWSTNRPALMSNLEPQDLDSIKNKVSRKVRQEIIDGIRAREASAKTYNYATTGSGAEYWKP